MKELVELLVSSLVKNPDQICVTERVENDTWIYEVTVAQEDMGKVIGKQGRIAKAIRTMAKAAATRENRRVMVEIIG
ncbi:MAG TPA: KH domain-containing protein [Negativicutes bacterium]|nr:KH domain-containing protein [Negativicutes bacterium]